MVKPPNLLLVRIKDKDSGCTTFNLLLKKIIGKHLKELYRCTDSADDYIKLSSL